MSSVNHDKSQLWKYQSCYDSDSQAQLCQFQLCKYQLCACQENGFRMEKFQKCFSTSFFSPKFLILGTDSILRVWISQVRRVKDFSVFLKGEMVHILFSKLFWPTLRKYDLMIEIVFEIWGWSLRVCKSGPLGILFRCIVLGKVIWHICWIMEIFFMRLSRL